jgi:8-oxo-dGTP pyrophosphatase MutT (NUDIX family)
MFNVRVYGLMIRDNKILLSDETYNGLYFTKFPGGGLQFGESTIDCLKREMQEEYNWDIIVKDHFYTTDFFVESIFKKQSQVLGIYYLIELADEGIYNFETQTVIDNSGSVRWKEISSLSVSGVTFPIDKKVIKLVKNKFTL